MIKHRFAVSMFSLLFIGFAMTGIAQAGQPNILVIWGDDIGQSNISAYTRGMMGYRTPNIDRIAKEGILFTDYYGEQSCTAGRSSFILGQSVFRSGLSKVGLPGADEGINEMDPTIAGMLKDQGYATGQFGKNHLGDRDEHLPTNHGFDEFYGNLYHLNAEEEPENEDYFKDPALQKKFGPRGVIHSWAQADGSQKIEDTGPLTKKRMETIDDDTSDAAIEFIEQQHKAGKPWFVWWSGTRMHFRTHVKPELRGISGQDEYSDGMVEHDMHIGKFLELLDELGIAGNTIVHLLHRQRPALQHLAGCRLDPVPRREEHQLGRRLARACAGSLARRGRGWLGQQRYRAPHGLAADLRGRRRQDRSQGRSARWLHSKSMGRDYKVHLDGYDVTEHLRNPSKAPSPRKEIFYFSDDGDLTALRYSDWKVIFMEQKTEGTLRVWMDPFVPLRVPLIFNLRRDPYERAETTSNTYYDWLIDRAFCWFPRRPMWATS